MRHGIGVGLYLYMGLPATHPDMAPESGVMCTVYREQIGRPRHTCLAARAQSCVFRVDHAVVHIYNAAGSRNGRAARLSATVAESPNDDRARLRPVEWKHRRQGLIQCGQ